jgi:hypothetical protein
VENRIYPYLVKNQGHIMARTAQIRKEKRQSIITLRHEGQSMRYLQMQSQKPSSAMMKLALMRTATGKADPELPLLQRIHSLELPASEIAAQMIKWNSISHQVTDASSKI